MIVYPHVKPGDQLLVDGLTREQEVTERRTSRGKTFDLGGNKFRLRSGIMPIHYHDGKRWQDVDLTVTERNGLVICDTAGYEVKFDKVVPSAVLEGDQGEAEVALDKIHGKSKVDAPSYRIEGNEIVYDYGDYSIHAEVRPGAVEFYKLLKTPAAPRRFEWVVKNEKRRMKFSRKSAGRDNAKNNLQMVTSNEGSRYIEEWTGKVGKIADPKTRRKAWVDEAEYPILVDTKVEVNVAADTDDVTEYLGAVTTNNFRASVYGTILLHGGLRFRALNIPAGAVITAAIIFVNSVGTLATTVANGHGEKVKVYGDLTADAPAFSNSDLPSAIAKTTGKFTMPEMIVGGPKNIFLTQAVNSIVAQAGWAANNDMRFAFLQGGTVSSHGKWTFVDYPAGGFAVMDVWYTFPGASMQRVRVGH
jgi:hypothetical protein